MVSMIVRNLAAVCLFSSVFIDAPSSILTINRSSVIASLLSMPSCKTLDGSNQELLQHLSFLSNWMTEICFGHIRRVAVLAVGLALLRSRHYADNAAYRPASNHRSFKNLQVAIRLPIQIAQLISNSLGR